MRFLQSVRLSMVLVIGLMVAGVALLPCTAFACSCLPSTSVAEGVSSAAAVFAGTVTKVDAAQGQLAGGADSVAVTFTVQKVWKGDVQSQLVVTTARDSASCGVNFEPGQDYLVYANQNEDAASGFSVSLCSRTTSLDRADSDIAALGEGKVPAGGQVSNEPGTPAASPASTPSVLPSTGMSSWIWITLLVGGILTVVATVVLRRIRA